MNFTSLKLVEETYPFSYLKEDCQKSTSSEGSEEYIFINLRQSQKQKSQLCKKFVAYGDCPYGNKCKFAHGSHQLRCKDQFNIRYKTKQCSAFFKNGSCNYGQRCNFLHRQISPLDKFSKWKKIKNQYRILIEESRIVSRFSFTKI